MMSNENNRKSDVDVEIKTITIERKIVEQGEDNQLKQQLNNYYEYYEHTIMRVFSNIEFIKCFINNSEKMQVLFDDAPCFMKNAYINAWHSITIDLCSLLRKSDTSFKHFINFVDSNREKVFTTDLYITDFLDEDNGEKVDNEDLKGFIKRERDSLDDVIKELRQKIMSHESDIDKVEIVRDKLYAHFDKKMLRREEREEIAKEVSIELLESLAKLAEELFNSVYYYDKYTYTYCTPTNSRDVLNLARACEMYDKYKRDIIYREHYGKWGIEE